METLILTNCYPEGQRRVLEINDHGKDSWQTDYQESIQNLVERPIVFNDHTRNVVENLEVHNYVKGSDFTPIFLTHFMEHECNNTEYS